MAIQRRPPGLYNISALKRYACWQLPDEAVTDPSIANGGVKGMTAPTIAYNTTAFTSGSTADGPQRDYNTSAVSGNQAGIGITGPFNITTPQYNPILSIHFGKDGDLTNHRIFVGLTDGNLNFAPPTTPAASAVRYVAFAWDAAVNGGKWLFCSGDGTNHSGDDTGIAAGDFLNGLVIIEIAHLSQEMILSVNGKRFIKTSNRPGSGTLGVYAAAETRAAASYRLIMGRFSLEHL